MPRSIDFRTVPMSTTNLAAAFARVLTEISIATGYPTPASSVPTFTSGSHLGAEINTAIDAMDALINSAAAASLQANPADGTRAIDFRTGTHDAARLHTEIDRLLARVARLSTRSINDTSAPSSRIAFARTSAAQYISLAGTLTTAASGAPRVGLPYVIRRNLFLSSNDFNTTWLKSNGLNNLTITANAIIGPFSGTYGSKLTPNAAAVAVYLNQGITVVNGSTYSTSVYAKAGEYAFLNISGDAISGRIASSAVFNLATGTVASTASGSASITPIGNGWYRCVATGVASSTGASPMIRPMVTASTYPTGDGTSGIYLFEADHNLGAVAPPQPTNATWIDFTNPLNGAGAIFEPARTNTVLQSNDLSVAPWVQNIAGGTVPTATPGPDGVVNGSLLTVGALGGEWQIYQAAIVAGVSPGAFSFSVKAGTAVLTLISVTDGSGGSLFQIACAWSGGIPTVTVSVGNGVILSVTKDGTLGYYRVSAIQTVNASAVNRKIIIYADYPHNVGATMSIADVQYEDGAPYSSSPIRTTTVAVTRAADTATTTLPAAISQNGEVEVYLVAPPISTGLHTCYFGLAQGISAGVPASALGVTRFAYQLTTDLALFLCRTHNGATGANGVAGSAYIGSNSVTGPSIWDGAPHLFKLCWSNYILAGVRYMWLRLYIDGALIAEEDVAALYGASAWSSLATCSISEGGVTATYSSGPFFRLGAVPAGALRVA